jgi:hypothetical protein
MTNTPVVVRFIRALILILGVFMCGILIVLEGCGSSALVSAWRDPAFQSPPLNSMLVIAVRKDPTRRRIWEDGFVVELSKHGVTATPSYRLFPNALPDTTQAEESIRTNGFAGVLVSRRLPPGINTNIVPGYVATEPVTKYNPWKNKYFTYYQEVQYPAYTDSEKVANHATEVWTTKEGGRMVWSGTTETSDPSSIHADGVVSVVVPELSRQGIIPPEK